MWSHAVYKVELAVASQSVSISAGGVTTSNIASQEAVNIIGVSLLGYPTDTWVLACCRTLLLSGKLAISMVHPEAS